jgi:hypothetical protein
MVMIAVLFRFHLRYGASLQVEIRALEVAVLTASFVLCMPIIPLWVLPQ